MRWIFGLMALALACRPTAAAPRPNVGVIVVDDLDNDELRVLGNEQLLTPNIGRLAREGMIFRNGYVTSTICTPSRFGILTENPR